MGSLRTALELVAILYAILSGFSLWILTTGGPQADGPRKQYTRDEKAEKARKALAVGSFVIWSIFGACAILWLSSWIVVRGIDFAEDAAKSLHIPLWVYFLLPLVLILISGLVAWRRK